MVYDFSKLTFSHLRDRPPRAAPRQYHRLQRIKVRGRPLLFRIWKEIGAFSQARIAFFQKLKCELRKRHFWIFLFLKKSSVELRFEEGSLFFELHRIKSCSYFKDALAVAGNYIFDHVIFSIMFDRMSKMPCLCHPNSYPVQVFCTFYCRPSDFKDALPVPS